MRRTQAPFPKHRSESDRVIGGLIPSFPRKWQQRDATKKRALLQQIQKRQAAAQGGPSGSVNSQASRNARCFDRSITPYPQGVKSS